MNIDEKIQYLDSQILYLKILANSKYRSNCSEINIIYSDRLNLKKQKQILLIQKSRIDKLNKLNQK